MIYDVLDLCPEMLDLSIDYLTLMWLHVLQLQEQLPQVHEAHLQFLLELEHSEGVVMESDRTGEHDCK